MNANKWKNISLIVQIIGGILALCHHIHKVFLYIGFPVLLYGIILEIIKWRCPYCRKHFFGKGEFIVKCPYCDRNMNY